MLDENEDVCEHGVPWYKNCEKCRDKQWSIFVVVGCLVAVLLVVLNVLFGGAS